MKKFKSLLAVVLSVMMVASVVVLPASAVSADVWDGTADTSWYNSTATEFTLTTAEQLAGLAVLVNTQSVTFAGKTIKLGADIQLQSDSDMANYASWSTSVAPANTWTPIGYYNVGNFRGTFDGQGYTISGMYINDSKSTLFGGRPGLFGYINGATIMNVAVTKSYVNGKNCTGIVAAFHSGNAPTFDNIAITDCTVVGTNDGASFIMGKMGGFSGQTLSFTNIIVESSMIQSGWGGGGLLGYASGGAMGAVVIENCDVELDLVGTYTDDRGVGGLIGYFGQYANPGKSTINTIDIKNTNVDVKATANRDVGGVVGTFLLAKADTITFDGVDVTADIDCHGSTVNISDIGAVISYVRVNELTGALAFKNMNVQGIVKMGQNSGGLIGRLNSLGTFKSFAAIEVDNVTMNVDFIAKKGTGNAQCVGGIIGLGQNNVGSLTVNKYTSNSSFSSISKDGGNSNFGGLVGSATFGTNTISNVTMNDTYEALGNSVGGLYGTTSSTSLEVSGSNITASISAGDNIGGLVGSATKMTTLDVTKTDINVTLNGTGHAGALGGTFGTALTSAACTKVNVTSTTTGNSLVGLEIGTTLIAKSFKNNSNSEVPGINVQEVEDDTPDDNPVEGEGCTCKTRPDWSAWYVDKVMVCTPGKEEDGHSYRVCRNCGGKEERVIKAEHRFSDWNTSCTLGLDENGMVNATRVCASCGTVEVSKEAMFATHKHTTWIVEKDATVNEDGVQNLICADCSTVLSTAPVSYDVEYTDISGHKYEADIKFVTERGLFNGMGDGKFEPETTMTRGMIVTVFARLSGVSEGEYKNNFTDVADESYYAPFVGWAQAAGIVYGYGDGTFRPNDEVTKEQAIAMIDRYLTFIGNTDTTSDEKATFSDLATGSEWAKGAVEELIRFGIVRADDTVLRPTESATRAELANFFANLLRYIEK